MFISDFAIKRPLVTTVVMILLVTCGVAALLALDTDEYPDIADPAVSVIAIYPGASPQQVEREVVDRMEEQFNGISGLDNMESTSRDGVAQIDLHFKYSTNVDAAAQDVRDAISEIRDNLPVEMREPIIRKVGLGDVPIVSLALTSETLTPAELTLIADPGITRVLRGINGVAQVSIEGADERTIAVNLRPRDLEAAHVSVGEVVGALNSQNLAAPVGSVTGELTERTIRLNGRIDAPQDFLRLVVAARGGQLIRLGQVASVQDTAVEARSLALYNGRPGIGIDITKTKGVSTTREADEVKSDVMAMQRTLPAGAKLSIVKDAGVRVRNSVRNVEDALIEGAALTVLVVFLFLNSWRSTVITGLALPVSTLAAFIAVWACGFTLNTMSLLGLSLAIGILIDDAIVVRENIVRHVEMGEDHFTAAHTGTNEIGLAVTATTFSIVAVFVPVAFMNGLAGQWFKSFALTIACAVLVSLFVSFSLDPMLSAYWPDPAIEAHARRRTVVGRALERFNHWFDAQADRYKTLIAWALDHRWLMVGITVVTFVGALALQAIRRNNGLVPISDRSEFTVGVETPAGSNLDYMRLKLQELDRQLRAHPEVAYTYATVGSGATSGAIDEGLIYVRLVPKSARRISQKDFAAVARQDLATVGGVTAYVFADGFDLNQKQIQIKVQGNDYAALAQVAAQVAAVVRAVPGAADVGLSNRGERPELHIDLDRALAGQLGVSVADVAQSLRPAFAGVHAGDWVDPTGKTRNVTVRLAPEDRANANDLSQMPLVLNGGQSLSSVPLGAVATISNQRGPAEVEHYDRDQVITVGANLEGRTLSQVSGAIDSRLKTVTVPPGVRIVTAGQARDLSGVIGDIAETMGLAILLMYMILVVQFGSFLDPLAIMLSLPLSLIGVVLALLLPGGQLDIMSILGVILLFGIVTKNAILLIDFAIWAQKKRGLSVRDALIEAGRIRLRPIMMTTVALVAGVLPVALGTGEGGDFRAGLGRAVIGGVITSTLLTLLVIPTFYEILDDWRARALGRGRRA